MREATAAAQDAFKSWRDTPVQQRARVYLKYQQLIRDHTEELAQLITEEQGKTLPDAKGDVFRGLEVVEHSCSAPSLTMGETVDNVAGEMDMMSFRQPLGVTAGICPFNFPAMIPLWMFPLATALGNTSLMKPSERDPSACMVGHVVIAFKKSYVLLLCSEVFFRSALPNLHSRLGYPKGC